MIFDFDSWKLNRVNSSCEYTISLHIWNKNEAADERYNVFNIKARYINRQSKWIQQTSLRCTLAIF